MNNRTRILLCLAQGKGTTEELLHRLGNVPHSTLASTLTKIRHAKHCEALKTPGTAVRIYRITIAGRAHLRRLGLAADAQPEHAPSIFGSFGERVPRVSTVFDLGGIAA